MKRFILSFALTIIAVSLAFSQVAPQKIEGWREFTAEDKSFTILLPEISRQKADAIAKAESIARTLFGGSKIYFKQSSLRNAAFGITYQNFSAPLLDNLEKEAQFESMSELIGEKTGDVFTSRIEDTDFSTNNKNTIDNKLSTEKLYGIQTVLELTDLYIFSRLFIVEQRLFRIMVILPQNEAESYRDDISTFFSSFRIGKIPPAKFAATPLPPKDFKVSFNKQNIQSEILNLSFQFPKDWIIEVFDLEKQKLSAEEQKQYEKQKSQLRWIWRNRQGFAWAESTTNKSNMALIVNRQPLADSKLQEFVTDRAKLYQAKQSEVEINGNKLLVLKRDQGISHYYTKWNDYFLEIYLEYDNEKDLKLMEESIKSLKILK